MDSNDSPEIPDRGETSDIPGLPSGVGKEEKNGKAERRETERVGKDGKERERTGTSSETRERGGRRKRERERAQTYVYITFAILILQTSKPSQKHVDNIRHASNRHNVDFSISSPCDSYTSAASKIFIFSVS